MSFLTGLPHFTLRDVIDILLVTILVYQLLRLIKGTRAVQVLLGIVSLALAYALTGPGRALELPTLHRILGGALVIIPFAIVVLFQNHIRRLLSSFGRNPLRGLAVVERTPEGLLSEIVLAVISLAARRHGALIVMEREQGLRTFAEAGISLDALVSHDLLSAIFNPASPLHDGAVIIHEGRVRAASCFVPLTAAPPMARAYGSRHRAGIGITEETDAVAVIVSEQTGRISVAREGRLHEDLGARELEEFLAPLFVRPMPLLARFGWGSRRPGRTANATGARP